MANELDAFWKGNEAVFPPDIENTPEHKKNTAKYHIELAKWYWDRFKKDRTAVGSAWASHFYELRAYGMSRQSTDKYKTFLAGASSGTSENLDTLITTNSRDQARKGYLNVSWENIMSPLSNLRAQVRGHFQNIDGDIRCDAVDINSGADEEKKMFDLYIDTHPVFGKLLNDLKAQANIPIEEPEFVPEDLQELQEYKEEGGFKSPYIQNMEKLLLHTEDLSGWDRQLKDKLISDLLDIGYIFAYTEFDPTTCKPVWRYADPQYVLMQYSHSDDFSDSGYCGAIERWTISKLKKYRDYIYHKDGYKITDEEFKQIARQYCKFDSNPDETEWNRFAKELSYGDYAIDTFKIAVCRTWWEDVENIKEIEYENKHGKTRLYDYEEPQEGEYDVHPGENSYNYSNKFKGNYSLNIEPYPNTKISKTTKRGDGFNVMAETPGRLKYTAKINIGKNEVIKKTRLLKIRQCSWIWGTDFVFDFGEMPNQARYEYSRPLLPMVGFRLADKSLVFRGIPIADMYQIAWLRLQNGLAKASQGGYAINTSLLGDGSKKLDSVKVLKAWRENGILFYKMGINGNVGGTPVPITYLPGNLQEVINGEAQIMKMCMGWLEDATGFSMVALGATPNPEVGLGVTQQSVQATQKSLVPLINAIFYVKEELAKRTSCMYQLAVKNDEKAAYEYSKVIGETGVRILQQAQSSDVQLGISLKARPDDTMRQAVIQAATNSEAKGEISADERLFIIEQVTSGQNLREIRMKLRKMIRKNKEMAHQMQLENVDRQNQGLQQTAMQQEMLKQKTEIEKMRMQDAMARLNAMTEITVRDHDSFRKIKEMIAQKKLEMGQMPDNPNPAEQQPIQQTPIQQPTPSGV